MNAKTPFAVSPVQIDGFPVQGFPSVEAAAQWILNTQNRPNIAVALNAEKLMSSRRKPEKYKALKNSAFFYPDGLPIVWLLRRRDIQSGRIPGVDLWQALMKEAGARKVYLLGASEEVNKATAEKLQAEFGLTNLRRQNGYFDDEDDVLRDMAQFQPDIVTVAMGSPRQEEFMARAAKLCPHTFFMGVGGTYDVFIGRLPRAPKWMQDMGLEWLFRTWKEPKRIWRNLSYLWFMYLYVTHRV